jgi:hypothetical protein
MELKGGRCGRVRRRRWRSRSLGLRELKWGRGGRVRKG